tara:strand:- start:546 stop:680 length:135 start_codon:yes stop_codon:yes gene_type:complete
MIRMAAAVDGEAAAAAAGEVGSVAAAVPLPRIRTDEERTLRLCF